MFCGKELILNPLGFFFILVNREWPIRSGAANDCFLGISVRSSLVRCLFVMQNMVILTCDFGNDPTNTS